MLEVQQSLIAKIKELKKFQTVKEYAGEITSDGVDTRIIFPAALVMTKTGTSKYSSKGCSFDILVITSSKSLDREEAANSNLVYSSALLDHLHASGHFEVDTRYYKADQDSLNAKIFLQNDKDTIFIIKAEFKRIR